MVVAVLQLAPIGIQEAIRRAVSAKDNASFRSLRQGPIASKPS